MIKAPGRPLAATLILCSRGHSTHLGQGPKVKGWLVIPDIRTPHFQEAHSKPNSRPVKPRGQVWIYKVGKVNSGEKEEGMNI